MYFLFDACIMTCVENIFVAKILVSLILGPLQYLYYVVAP